MNQLEPFRRRCLLSRGSFAALSLLGTAALVTGLASARAQEESRLVILGFDGADGRTVEEMMAKGELPNLTRLRDGGTFARLGTSVPNESPTSWASLNSGQNPGKTNVSGFVKRDLSMMAADFGFIEPNDPRAIETFDDLPLPAWPAAGFAAACAGGVFVLFLVVFAGLLRLRFGLSAALSSLLACAGGFAGYEARGLLPAKIPRTSNPNKARNLWDHAADHGVESIVLEAAQAFDMETPEGARVLAGLGVPDARGDIGSWFIYTDDELLFDRPPEGTTEGASTAGRRFRVDWRDDKIQTTLAGPRNFYEIDRVERELADVDARLVSPKTGNKESSELNARKADLKKRRDALKREEGGRTQVDLVLERRGPDRIAVELDGQEQVLGEGEWSDFYHLTFELNPLLEVKAVTRVKLVSLASPFELFVNTIDIDPEHPPFWQPISSPHDFAPELVKTSGGSFETYGWACVTMPFKDKRISVETLLEDIEFTLRARERVADSQLKRADWRLFMSVESTPDRLQHMLYQYYDEGHPLYDAAEANREVTFFGKKLPLSDAIPEIYRQVDRIVGEVMDDLGPNDTLLVCSDHGFQSCRRQVSLNNWLLDEGYLVLKNGVRKSDNGHLRFVDWSKTKAYSLGLGFIYVNERGREPNGIVDPKDKAALLDAIQEGLLQLRDPENGEQAVTESYRIAEEHSGAYLREAADLVLGFAPTYRSAWTSSTGGINLKEEGGKVVPGAVFADNESPWSGDHPSVGRDHVKGIFFCNRKVTLPEGGPNLLHIAPTALDLLGVPIPSEMDLPPLAVAR